MDKKTQPEKEEFISDKSEEFAKELETLAQEEGYDSIRFFIAPDKTVSVGSVIEDVRAFFLAKKSGQKMRPLYNKKR